MPKGRHSERLKSELQNLAAEFLNREANKLSLITVTGLELSNDGKRAKILLSVFPSAEEESALKFARRKRVQMVEYIHERLRVGFLPRLDFAIDQGEKHRQRIDEISNKL